MADNLKLLKGFCNSWIWRIIQMIWLPTLKFYAKRTVWSLLFFIFRVFSHRMILETLTSSLPCLGSWNKLAQKKRSTIKPSTPSLIYCNCTLLTNRKNMKLKNQSVTLLISSFGSSSYTLRDGSIHTEASLKRNMKDMYWT